MTRPLRRAGCFSELPHTAIRVIPFEATCYPGPGQSLYYVRGPVPVLDTAQLDQSHGPVSIDAESQLAEYRLLLERLDAASPNVNLNVKQSQELIHKTAQGL
ncbi:Scr1 family TA system antitoxin-like transcriptional regulator [Streptomyces sp. NPDC088727]|uniref:Scr1 family TA system antitoxin-like transcriptional regulator n=1 Tax=Streptomyces sp. NPDC088727 TaxID=3365875 RepID=UPI00382458F7